MSISLSLLAKQKTYEITSLLPETEYTVSINGTYNSPVEVWLTTLVMVDDEIIEKEVNSNNAVYVGDLENNKLTFTAQESHTALVIRTLGELEFTTIQLEKGNVATDWTPAPEDVQNEITRVETTLTGKITTEANRITAEVSERTNAIDALTGEIGDVLDYAESNIDILKNQIVLKSDTNGNLVLVKLDSSGDNGTSFNVSADNIDLSGYVTVSSLSGQGTTTIDGSNIKTGTISANRINFNGATGTNVTLSGNITATKVISATDNRYYGEVGLTGEYVGLGLYDLRHGTTPYFQVLEMPTNGFLITDYNNVRRFAATGAYTRIQHSNNTTSFDSTISETRIMFGNSEIGIDYTGPYYVKNGGSKVYF